MSTAEPVLDGSNEFYYSVLAQGAGLARVDKAMDSSTYILMDPGSNKGALDGKVKAELGEQDNNFQVGDEVYIEGNFRSINKIIDEKSHLILYVYANKIEKTSIFNKINQVQLKGFICKQPI